MFTDLLTTIHAAAPHRPATAVYHTAIRIVEASTSDDPDERAGALYAARRFRMLARGHRPVEPVREIAQSH